MIFPSSLALFSSSKGLNFSSKMAFHGIEAIPRREILCASLCSAKLRKLLNKVLASALSHGHCTVIPYLRARVCASLLAVARVSNEWGEIEGRITHFMPSGFTA